MITACRLCGATVRPVLDLGVQQFTGIFPRTASEDVGGGPLVLVKCFEGCGLVQLGHNFDPAKMYGDEYGYRSGLNASMVRHLRLKATRLQSHLIPGDVALDIGSNDGTFLGNIREDVLRIGMDPTAGKFGRFYPDGVAAVPAFFDPGTFLRATRGRQAKLITSIACFYDMPDPLGFARGVSAALRSDGLWHTEQSYLPAMLASGSYDTVCHEHIEYYAMRQLVFIAEQVGFQIVDVETNDVNGGSFAVTMRKGYGPHVPAVAEMLAAEGRQDTGFGQSHGLDDEETYRVFARRVERGKTQLVSILEGIRESGRSVVGLGASTKGNVILQYCGIGPELVSCIGEVNPDKFGRFTPGTRIPIVPEREVFIGGPYAALVLPWHFRRSMRERYRPAMENGCRLLFPLPYPEFCLS